MSNKNIEASLKRKLLDINAAEKVAYHTRLLREIVVAGTKGSPGSSGEPTAAREYGYKLSCKNYAAQVEWRSLNKALWDLDDQKIFRRQRNELNRRILSAFLADALSDIPLSEDFSPDRSAAAKEMSTIKPGFLKDGVFTDSITDILTRADAQVPASAYWQLSARPALAALLQYGWLDILCPGKITEAEWMEGMELSASTMLKINDCSSSSVTLSQDMKDAITETNYAMTIYFSAICHTIHMLSSRLLSQSCEGVSKQADQNESQAKRISALETQLAAAKREIETLNAEIKNLQSVADAAARAATDALAHEHLTDIRRRDAQIRSLEERNSALQEQLAGLSEPEEVPVPSESSGSTPLPTSNVIFLGGHQNMVKKLRNIHRDWTFVTDNQPVTFSKPPECVFFWSGHVSHHLSRKFFSKLPKGVPVIYLTSTNLDLLDQEMHEKYGGAQCETIDVSDAQ